MSGCCLRTRAGSTALATVHGFVTGSVTVLLTGTPTLANLQSLRSEIRGVWLTSNDTNILRDRLKVQDAMTQLGVDGKYLQSKQQTDYAKNLQQFVDEKVDLIMPLTTQCLQAALITDRTIPVVFGSVVKHFEGRICFVIAEGQLSRIGLCFSP